MALIPPHYMDCVVAIGFKSSGGDTAWAASGFFYGHKISGPRAQQKKYKVFLVTNRHVFKGKSDAFIRCNPIGRYNAKEFDLKLVNATGKPQWITHQNDNIDVAAIAISTQVLQQQNIQFSVFTSDDDAANMKDIKKLGITEGDSAFILGFPMGFVGKRRNTVHVRGGVISRIRDLSLKRNTEFLVDAMVFPGNSGGPVISRPELTAIRGTKSQNASHLIGIVTSYVPYRDVAVSQQTGKVRVVFEENSGLAAAHPIDFVQQVIQSHIKSMKKAQAKAP